MGQKALHYSEFDDDTANNWDGGIIMGGIGGTGRGGNSNTSPGIEDDRFAAKYGYACSRR